MYVCMYVCMYICMSRITHAVAGEATTIQMDLQEMDVSVYNTVPRTSYGCYRRAEVLETHVYIAHIDIHLLSISSGQISAETETTQTLI